MKLLLSFTLSLIALSSFASNKICVGENIIVVFHEELKTLSIHNKETMEVLQSTELEGESFGEIALSSDDSKIWFKVGKTMFCRDVESGEILKEIHGSNLYTFELSNTGNYLIHFERELSEKALIYVYDLNSGEAISYAKLDFPFPLETIHYDHAKKQVHLLSRAAPSKTETPSKEPLFGVPESTEQIALGFLHDQMDMKYLVYDITGKAVLHDQLISYSPNSACNFEIINEKLYIITAIGTAEVLDDFTFQLTDFVAPNLRDYAILGSELFGVNGYFLFSHSFETGKNTKLDDFEANTILLKGRALAVTEDYYYCFNETILYRIRREDPMGIDFETSLER